MNAGFKKTKSTRSLLLILLLGKLIRLHSPDRGAQRDSTSPKVAEPAPGHGGSNFGGSATQAADADPLLESELTEFLQQHGDRVYTYLCVLCRDEDRAAEALQNAYEKFLAQVRRARVQRATAVQYLQTIARNDYFTRLRKEGREELLPEDSPDTRTPNRTAREEVARELRLILLQAVEEPRLPEDLRQVMRLRFLEERDVAAICQKTGRSQATVYRLMEKALAVLAEDCKKAGLVPEDLGL